MEKRKKPKINIPNPEEVFNDVYIPLISESKETNVSLIVLEGGRASGKTRAACQRLVLSSLKRKMRICLMRKVFDTIRDSLWREIKDTVDDWELSNHFKFNKSPLDIKNNVGSEFISKGLDKAEKTKSLANVDVLVIEEATELTLDDFETVLFTIRGNTNYGQPKLVILIFNRKLGNWTEEYFFHGNGQFKVNDHIYHLHTTFLNNKFLSYDDIQRFERLKLEDEKKYQKIALGLPIKLEGLVYENWDIVSEMPECREYLYGLDFGFTDPKALVKCGRIGNDLYLDEILYERKLIREDFIKRMPSIIQDKGTEIWADSEDPESIQVIFNAGWNIYAVDKTKGSVIFGVEAVQSFKIYITERSTNVIKDFENYKWKQKKDGSPVEKEEPAHSFSHAPRAVEYAVRSRWSNLNPMLTSGDIKSANFPASETSQIKDGYQFESNQTSNIRGW